MSDIIALLNDPALNNPANWAMLLAVLVALAFVILALKPRDEEAREPAAEDEPAQVSAAETEEEIEKEAPPPERPRETAFERLTGQGVAAWNAARAGGEFVEADFSDVGDAFQSKAEGSKIWGRPIEYHDPNPRLMLRGIDLVGANLSGCNLRRADLRGADLTEASLAGAHLERAILSNARLTDADLRGARLDNAVLANANLAGANLEDASVDGANLAWAELRGAKGNRRQLEKLTDLHGARLAGASFDGAEARWLIAGRNLLSKKPFLRRR